MPQISPLGTISQPIGPGTLTLNPITQTAGVSGNANILDTGDLDLNVGFGVGAGPGGVGAGITPNLQIGQGQGSQAGASLGGSAGGLAGGIFGGPLGAAGGSLIGSAAGSLIGSTFNKSQKNKEHQSRNTFINKLREFGLFDDNYQFLFPDGTTGNFEGGAGQVHGAKDPSKLVGQKRDQLFGFETDYTNDLDYVAAMGGITLARLLGGGKDKAIDQVGNLIGNQSLGKLGYGQDFTPENFNSVIDNLRSVYAKAGIKSKEEFLALSNEGFAQTRFNDADRAVAQQVANLIFDKDFGQASALMAGRQKGLDVAAQGPAQRVARGPRKGTIFSGRETGIKGARFAPIISFEEAQLATAPAVAYLQSLKGRKTEPSSLQQFVNDLRGVGSIVGGLGDIVKGGVGLYNQIFGDSGGSGGSQLPGFDFGAGQGGGDSGFSLGGGELDLGDEGGVGGIDTSDFDLGDTLDFSVF